MKSKLLIMMILTSLTCFSQNPIPIPSSEAIAKDNAKKALDDATAALKIATDNYNIDNSPAKSDAKTNAENLLIAKTKIYNAALDAETKKASTDIITPLNIYFTINEIKGNASPNSVVQFVIDDSDKISVTVNNFGYFEYTFHPKLDATKPNIVKLWGIDGNQKLSIEHPYTVKNSDEILKGLIDKSIKLPEDINKNPEIDGNQTPSTIYKYKVTMLNTNFTVPLARFNFINDGSDTSKGQISLFTSIGAGFGFSWGEIEKTTDANGNTLNVDYSNTYGVNVGVLFSSGKDGETQKNVFAPTVAFTVLDFQIGLGYELGTVLNGQKQGFLNLAYAIPISKLLKGKYYIYSSSKGYNAQNPLTTEQTKHGQRKTKHRFIS